LVSQAQGAVVIFRVSFPRVRVKTHTRGALLHRILNPVQQGRILKSIEFYLLTNVQPEKVKLNKEKLFQSHRETGYFTVNTPFFNG